MDQTSIDEEVAETLHGTPTSIQGWEESHESQDVVTPYGSDVWTKEIFSEANISSADTSAPWEETENENTLKTGETISESSEDQSGAWNSISPEWLTFQESAEDTTNDELPAWLRSAATEKATEKPSRQARPNTEPAPPLSEGDTILEDEWTKPVISPWTDTPIIEESEAIFPEKKTRKTWKKKTSEALKETEKKKKSPKVKTPKAPVTEKKHIPDWMQ